MLHCYRCIYRFKGTNFKAIHNELFDNKWYSVGVYTDLKVRILKQFTTIVSDYGELEGVYIPI